MNIEILDKTPGTGKTYSALKYIENLALSENQHWVYATEYLNEIEERAMLSSSVVKWRTPERCSDETKQRILFLCYLSQMLN